VESELGQGSRFFVSLPLWTDVAPAESKEAAQQPEATEKPA